MDNSQSLTRILIFQLFIHRRSALALGSLRLRGLWIQIVATIDSVKGAQHTIQTYLYWAQALSILCRFVYDICIDAKPAPFVETRARAHTY